MEAEHVRTLSWSSRPTSSSSSEVERLPRAESWGAEAEERLLMIPWAEVRDQVMSGAGWPPTAWHSTSYCNRNIFHSISLNSKSSTLLSACRGEGRLTRRISRTGRFISITMSVAGGWWMWLFSARHLGQSEESIMLCQPIRIKHHSPEPVAGMLSLQRWDDQSVASLTWAALAGVHVLVPPLTISCPHHMWRGISLRHADQYQRLTQEVWSHTPHHLHPLISDDHRLAALLNNLQCLVTVQCGTVPEVNSARVLA